MITLHFQEKITRATKMAYGNKRPYHEHTEPLIETNNQENELQTETNYQNDSLVILEELTRTAVETADSREERSSINLPITILHCVFFAADLDGQLNFRKERFYAYLKYISLKLYLSRLGNDVSWMNSVNSNMPSGRNAISPYGSRGRSNNNGMWKSGYRLFVVRTEMIRTPLRDTALKSCLTYAFLHISSSRMPVAIPVFLHGLINSKDVAYQQHDLVYDQKTIV